MGKDEGEPVSPFPRCVLQLAGYVLALVLFQLGEFCSLSLPGSIKFDPA